MSDEEPFASAQWLSDLTSLLKEHELDQRSGVDAEALVDFMSGSTALLVSLVNERDRGMPEALGAVERAELAALRRVIKSQEVWLAQCEDRLAERDRAVINLEILLKDAYTQRDRALKTLSAE